jgi:1,2-diacylglycerol 3-alpha-glucosyltransferase
MFRLPPPPPSGLRIGMFTDTYSPQINGVVTSVRDLSHGLSDSGHTVTIVAPSHPKQQPEERVFRLRSVTYRPQPEYRMAWFPSPRRILALRRQQFDIIHTHGSVSVPLIGLVLARTFGIPIVHTYHTRMRDYIHYYPWYPTMSWIAERVPSERTAKRLKASLDNGTMRIGGSFDRWFCNRCATIIAPAEPIAAELLEMGIYKPIKVIHNGIDISKFAHKGPDPYLKFGLQRDGPNGGPRLMCVGRLGREKSMDVLLERFALVHRQRPAARLILLGDGPERPALEQQARSLGIAAAVTFVGYVDPTEVADYYHHADLFVFASTSEVHPIVGLEAAAAGLPIVARAKMGITKCVLHNETGYLIDPDDEIAYRDAVVRLIDQPELRQAFAKRAAAWAEATWSHRRMTERVLDIYEHAMSGFSGWEADDDFDTKLTGEF